MDNSIINIQNNPLSEFLDDMQKPSEEEFVLNFQLYLPLYIAKGRATPDTLRDYAWKINAFLRWCFERKRNPLELTSYELVHYRKYLADNDYASSTMSQMLNAVKAFYRIAVKMGYIDTNPITDIDVYVQKAKDSDYYYYDLDSMKKIVDAAADNNDEYRKYRNTLIIMLLGFQGLRNIELHRLNDGDIDLENKIMTVRGKGHAGRTDSIGMSEIVVSIARKYLEARPAKYIEDELGIPFFRSFNQKSIWGKRMSRIGYQRIVNSVLLKAGVKRFGACCHVLRHSCGTNLYQQGKDLRLVQNFLRHSDPSVTARYTHIKDESTYDAINSITRGIKIE